MATAYGVEPKRPWRTAVRFWTKIEVGGSDECWPWMGTTNSGYGRLQFTGSDGSRQQPRAHVVAWRAENEQPVPDGMVLHHTCEAKNCCNPHHLIAMKPGEHSRHHIAPGGRCKRGHDDWHVRGKQLRCRTCENELRRKGPREPLLVCKHGHNDWVILPTQRRCRTCMTEYQHEWRARHPEYQRQWRARRAAAEKL
jgi:hypothetical protein